MLCRTQPSKQATLSEHPTPQGADDERSETFTPPVRWAVRMTLGRSACRRRPTHAERTTNTQTKLI